MTETLSGPETGNMEFEKTGPKSPARFLALLLDALAAASTARELAPRITDAVAETMAGWSSLWLQDRLTGEFRLAAISHSDAEQQPIVGSLTQDWPPLRYQGLISKIVSLHRPVSLPKENEEQLSALFGSDSRALLAAKLGCESVVLAPLAHGHRTIGLLLLASADPWDLYLDSPMELIGEVVRHIGTALAHIQRLEAARQTSQRLTISNLHLQAILDSIPQGVIVATAPDGRIVSSSRAFAQILGRPIDSKVPVSAYPRLYGFASPTGEPFLPDDLPWVQAIRTGEATKVQEMVIHQANGHGITVLCSSSPIQDESGDTVGSVALLQDISDRKELELQKDEFLAMVAHELKTPLTAVKGYVQLVLRLSRQQPDHTLGPREIGMLEVADRQITRLGQLVFDLLDFSLIRMGRLDLRRIGFSLSALARDVVAQMQVTAPDRVISLADSESTGVLADPHRVEQLLINLLSNAIKATAPGGHVQIRIRRIDSSVVTSIQDDGAGMPREVQERIFERYFRGPDRNHEGMGLGLYISKGIVDAHGGRIWLESEVGSGTSFHFSLPVSD